MEIIGPQIMAWRQAGNKPSSEVISKYQHQDTVGWSAEL